MKCYVSSYQLDHREVFDLASEDYLTAEVIQSILRYLATLSDHEFVYLGITFQREVKSGEIAFEFSPNINSKQFLLMIERLYDLLVYLTTNYSSMSDEFRNQFSEADCVRLRQALFNILDFQ